MGFFSFRRSGESMALGNKEFDPKQHLTIKDIVRQSDKSASCLNQRYVDTFCQGVTIYL